MADDFAAHTIITAHTDCATCTQLRAPEQCIDIMVEVALDGTQDSFIVREAGHFWKELGMRETETEAKAITVITHRSISAPGNGPPAAVAVPDEGLAHEALAWATNVKEPALLADLSKSLPAAVLEEQIKLYQGRSGGTVAKTTGDMGKILVSPNFARSRIQVAEAFNEYLESRGWTRGKRIPRNATPDFVEQMLHWSRQHGALKPSRLVRITHQTETETETETGRGRDWPRGGEGRESEESDK
jgi:hypothetical protein